MKTFKLGAAGKDIEFDEYRNITQVEGADEIVQSIRQLLSTNQGEWFLKPDFGLEYSRVFKKQLLKNEEDIRAAILETFKQDERIQKIVSLNLNFDRVNRILRIDFIVVASEIGKIVDEIQVEW